MTTRTKRAPVSGLDTVRDDLMYGTGAVCVVAGLHRTTVYGMLARGELPGVRLRCGWRVLGADLRRLCRATAAPEPTETAAQRAKRAGEATARLKRAKRVAP